LFLQVMSLEIILLTRVLVVGHGRTSRQRVESLPAPPPFTAARYQDRSGASCTAAGFTATLWKDAIHQARLAIFNGDPKIMLMKASRKATMRPDSRSCGWVQST
jgi:hypothetical protein